MPTGQANPAWEEKWLEPPYISIQSPLNQTHTKDLFLNFSIDSPESWLIIPVSFSNESGNGLVQRLLSVTYSIDETIYGSFSLDTNLSSPFTYSTYLGNLSNGEHMLKVWANATGVVRNWISNTVYSVPISNISLVYFTIDSKLPDVNRNIETEQFPVVPVALISIVAVIAVATGLQQETQKKISHEVLR